MWSRTDRTRSTTLQSRDTTSPRTSPGRHPTRPRPEAASLSHERAARKLPTSLLPPVNRSVVMTAFDATPSSPALASALNSVVSEVAYETPALDEARSRDAVPSHASFVMAKEASALGCLQRPGLVQGGCAELAADASAHGWTREREGVRLTPATRPHQGTLRPARSGLVCRVSVESYAERSETMPPGPASRVRVEDLSTKRRDIKQRAEHEMTASLETLVVAAYVFATSVAIPRPGPEGLITDHELIALAARPGGNRDLLGPPVPGRDRSAVAGLVSTPARPDAVQPPAQAAGAVDRDRATAGRRADRRGPDPARRRDADRVRQLPRLRAPRASSPGTPATATARPRACSCGACGLS